MKSCCTPSAVAREIEREPIGRSRQRRRTRARRSFPAANSRWATMAPTRTRATAKVPGARSASSPFRSRPQRSPIASSATSCARRATSPTPSAPVPPSSFTSRCRRRSAARFARSRAGCPGGCPWRTRRGSGRKARARTFARGPTIRWSTCRGTTRRRIARGRERACRPKPNGSAPRAAVSKGARFAWGDELLRNGAPRCNVWRGTFPHAPAPGWRPEPVAAASGEANGYGLFNICGNVWEWCGDWFAPGRRSLRGGSYLCHDSYCNRYRVAARYCNTPGSTASNIGFRVAG